MKTFAWWFAWCPWLLHPKVCLCMAQLLRSCHATWGSRLIVAVCSCFLCLLMCLHMVLEGIDNRRNPWDYLEPLQRQSATHCEWRFICAHVVSFVVVLCNVSATVVPCVIMCMRKLCKVWSWHSEVVTYVIMNVQRSCHVCPCCAMWASIVLNIVPIKAPSNAKNNFNALSVKIKCCKLRLQKVPTACNLNFG